MKRNFFILIPVILLSTISVDEIFPQTDSSYLKTEEILEDILQEPVGDIDESDLYDQLEQLLLGLYDKPGHPANVVAIHAKRTHGGDTGIKLAKGPGGQIARIGEGGKTVRSPLAIQLLEIAFVEEHLASNLEEGWEVCTIPLQSQGDRPDGAQACGDILADATIASSGTLHQTSVSVNQLDRKAIELRFAHVTDSLGL